MCRKLLPELIQFRPAYFLQSFSDLQEVWNYVILMVVGLVVCDLQKKPNIRFEVRIYIQSVFP